MKKFLFCLLVLGIAAAMQWQADAVQTPDFKIIVNSANPKTSIGKSQVSSYLLKKKSRWDGWDAGVGVDPVDLAGQSPVRVAMSEEIHGRSVASIKNYWQRQIFSGRSTPPPELDSESEVVSFVESNRGAIGYVSAATRVSGDAKELSILDD